MYHRTYDAFLLAVPIAALVARAAELGPARRWAAGLALSAFLWPGAPVLRAAADAGALPAWLAGTEFWRVVLIPQQVWALLLLEAVLASLLLRPRARPEVAR